MYWAPPDCKAAKQYPVLQIWGVCLYSVLLQEHQPFYRKNVLFLSFAKDSNLQQIGVLTNRDLNSRFWISILPYFTLLWGVVISCHLLYLRFNFFLIIFSIHTRQLWSIPVRLCQTIDNTHIYTRCFFQIVLLIISDRIGFIMQCSYFSILCAWGYSFSLRSPCWDSHKAVLFPSGTCFFVFAYTSQ